MNGWPARAAGSSDLHPLELTGLVALGGAVVIGLPAWAAAQLAALLHTGHGVGLTLRAAAHAALAWASHPGDPVRGFPAGARAAIDNTALLYASLGLIVASACTLAFVVLTLTTRMRGRRGFASGSEVRRALSAAAARNRGHAASSRTRRRQIEGPAGLYLGRDLRSRQHLYGAAEDSYLYLGPPRSGKGVHLIIPQTIEAPGPTLVTATRADTLLHTLALRAERGPVAVFDPQALAGAAVPRLRWAPQRGCVDPLTAIARARALAAGAQLNTGAVTDGAFWQQMTEAVLRCYLHAAALG